ncbi:MAG: hypothetical protein V4477_05890 [Pseudomonadota bacterium]
MPRFYFDLVDGTTVPDTSGQVLRDQLLAAEVADKLAGDIYKVRPELRGKHFVISVRNEEGNEIHRADVIGPDD